MLVNLIQNYVLFIARALGYGGGLGLGPSLNMSTPEEWFRTHIPLPGYDAGKHWTDDHDKVGLGSTVNGWVRVGCNLGSYSRFCRDRRVFLVLIIVLQGFFCKKFAWKLSESNRQRLG